MAPSSSLLAVLLVLVLVAGPANAFVDLFLDSNETSALLGYPGSFFYVFNGEVRYSSISYRLDIPENKDAIEFAWKTAGSLPKLVSYRLNITESNGTLLAEHALSVNSTGLVPSALSRFKLFPACPVSNYSRTDAVYISLNAVFRLNNSGSFITTEPQINLTIQFRKLCSHSHQQRLKDVLVRKSAAASDFTVAYIIIGALGGFAFFVSLVGLVMYFRNRLNAKRLKLKYDSLYGVGKQALIAAASAAGHGCETKSAGKDASYSQGPKSTTTTTTTSYVKNERQGGQRKPRRPRESGGTDPKTAKLKLRKDRVNAESSKALRDPMIEAGSGAEAGADDYGSSPNIYETLQDASTSIIVINQLNDNNEYTSTRLNLNARKSTSDAGSVKASKYQLNLTTNTIQSVHNNTANNASSLSLTTLQNTNANTTSNRAGARISHSQQLNSVDLCRKFKASQIELGKVIMNGTYGCMYEGYVTISDDEKTAREDGVSEDSPQHSGVEQRVRVLVKTINDCASLAQADTMLRESCLLRGIKLKNINPILGICVEADARPMALFPFCEFGNLKHYLLVIRLNSNAVDADAKLAGQCLMTTQETLYIVLQLLKAVNYLHGKRLVHRDVAARNCWLDSNFSLKLADYSLSRDMFPDDYACLSSGGGESRPVKWMSPEAIRKGVRNMKADIWSVGVTIWECFSLSSQPYDHVDPLDMVSYLEQSAANRLERPASCPPELWDLVSRCWSAEPTGRPSLKALFHDMHLYYARLENYV